MVGHGRRLLLDAGTYNKPEYCSKCGGLMVYKGVGEYRCDDCRNVEYDDYGKVRLYIEKHNGAKATDIEVGTGVTQKSIRQMISDSKLQVVGSQTSFWGRK